MCFLLLCAITESLIRTNEAIWIDVPSKTYNVSHTSEGHNSFHHSKCSWGIACWRCSNPTTSSCFIGLSRDNYKTRRGTFKCWGLLRIMGEVWWCLTRGERNTKRHREYIVILMNLWRLDLFSWLFMVMQSITWRLGDTSLTDYSMVCVLFHLNMYVFSRILSNIWLNIKY